MAGLTSQERLQPSLLDRLTDHDPRSRVESAEARVLNRQQLRAAVLRDLGWLFNTTRHEPSQNSPLDAERGRWESAPYARRSVLNYGLPALAGESMGSLDFDAIERNVHDALIAFEPRIDGDTLEVQLSLDGSMRDHQNALRLVIRGKMWNQPIPLEILLSADLDVETGTVSIKDMR
ncbi:MAG: type VI secretion system baseplate subunit TssE [Burkholderiaceae bacterium]